MIRECVGYNFTRNAKLQHFDEKNIVKVYLLYSKAVQNFRQFDECSAKLFANLQTLPLVNMQSLFYFYDFVISISSKSFHPSIFLLQVRSQRLQKQEFKVDAP